MKPFSLTIGQGRALDVIASIDTDLDAADIDPEVRIKFPTILVMSAPDVEKTDTDDGVMLTFTLVADDMDQEPGEYQVEVVDANEDRRLAVGKLKIDTKAIEVTP